MTKMLCLMIYRDVIMPAPSAFGGGGGPSCFDRMKMGFMIGFSVGMASGALFGGFSAMRLESLYTNTHIRTTQTLFITVKFLIPKVNAVQLVLSVQV